MKRLLQDDVHDEQAKKPTSTKSQKGDDVHMSRIRVVTAKYKVYIVLLLIFICALLLNYIPDIKQSYESKQNTYNQVHSQLTAVRTDIRRAEDDMVYLGDITSNEQNLKTCLNEKKKEVCLRLPESWIVGEGTGRKYDFSVPLSYLQLHSLYNKKMPVDEKKVLKNLNEYLIKQDINGGARTRVGDILKISIGDPHSVNKNDSHFFQVPVKVTIEFTTIGDLTGFLYNVEKKMVEKGEDRILYKIQSVSYDIIASDKPQITDISMLAYYYHDERFENLDETTVTENSQEPEKSSSNNENHGTSKKNNSEGFLNKIFKS